MLSLVGPRRRKSPHFATRKRYVEPYEFPLLVQARYEVRTEGRVDASGGGRRAIRGGFQAEIPPVTSSTTVLAELMDGPRTDIRVPLTSWSFFGWRL
jgi:hypothetical protein